MALRGGCGIFHLGFSFSSLLPSFTPNQVYDAQRPYPDPDRQNIWPKPVCTERVLSHMHQGRSGASALGWKVVPNPGHSHPGLSPQNPACPRTSLRGAPTRRPPHSVGVPSSRPRVGRGTPTLAPRASNCCLGALVFPPLGQPHREKPQGQGSQWQLLWETHPSAGSTSSVRA